MADAIIPYVSPAGTARRRLHGWLTDVHRTAHRWDRSTDRQLRDVANDMRGELRDGVIVPKTEVQIFGLAKVATRRALGVDLYDVQLAAARALIHRQIAEMQTGEGKTLAAVPAAVLLGLTGQGVHVANPNAYLAERDYCRLRPVFDLLGMHASLLPEGDADLEKAEAYRADITYGTGYEYGFDFLRDQLDQRCTHEARLGDALLRQLQQPAPPAAARLRGLRYGLVDEADHVLVDDASSPLVLAAARPGVAEDAPAVLAARDAACHLTPERDFRQSGPEHLVLTESGRAQIHRGSIPSRCLRRAWADYVEAALRAKFLFRRDVHYVVQDDTVSIVDRGTGRIFEDRTWQDGLQQAIEVKEGLAPSRENHVLAQVTRQQFYRRYHHLAGMTGTAELCRAELKHVYGLEVTTIPTRLPCRRQTWPWRVFATQDAKWRAIAESVAEQHALGRPVLVGTRTIAG